MTDRADAFTFTAPPGGVMTEEVGVITGQLEARIKGDRLRIRYQGALDEYTVVGDVHGRSEQEILQHLTSDPGLDQDTNPMSVDLSQDTDNNS